MIAFGRMFQAFALVSLSPVSGMVLKSRLAQPEVPPSEPEPVVSEVALVPPSQAELPAGWFEYVNESSGHTYYYNSATNMTQWERPLSGTESVSSVPETELAEVSAVESEISKVATSTELAQLGSFHRASHSIGEATIANGPFACNDTKVSTTAGDEITEKRPMCTGDWGYFWRAKLNPSSDYNMVAGFAPGYASYQCGNDHWFIACLDRDQFKGSTHDVLFDVQDWCLQLNQLLYKMARSPETPLAHADFYTEMRLSSIKQNCDGVASHEATVRLLESQNDLARNASYIKMAAANARHDMPLQGPQGDQGPLGEPGPAGPPGEAGPQGNTGASRARAGHMGQRGPHGRDGTHGRNGTSGIDGVMYVPDAASCKGDYCTWKNQYCPGDKPGSSGSGYCCGSSGSWEYAAWGRRSCR